MVLWPMTTYDAMAVGSGDQGKVQPLIHTYTSEAAQNNSLDTLATETGCPKF